MKPGNRRLRIFPIVTLPPINSNKCAISAAWLITILKKIFAIMIHCPHVQKVQRAAQNLHQKTWRTAMETAAAQAAFKIFHKGQLTDIASF